MLERGLIGSRRVRHPDIASSNNPDNAPQQDQDADHALKGLRAATRSVAEMEFFKRAAMPPAHNLIREVVEQIRHCVDHKLRPERIACNFCSVGDATKDKHCM